MATIDLDITKLKQSTNPRGSSPNGNIYFDKTTGVIQLITVEELTTVDFGAGAVANPLTNYDGVTMHALYAFERQERKVDETIRYVKPWFGSSRNYKYAGAFELINGRKFDATDRTKIRSSGWVERAATDAIDRIYFGVRSLGTINMASAPYYQLAAGGDPSAFSKAGPINEAIQVFGSTANGDSGAGSFDSRTYLAISVRTFGKTYDRKVLADSGVTTMDGYSTGFALGEANHLTTGNYTLSNVYGGAQIAPWTGMTLEHYGSAQMRTGFNEGSGTFGYVLHNAAGGSLDQVVAYLDSLAQTDNDIDEGAGVIHGKRVGTWYSYDAQGRIVTMAGLVIDNLPTSDQQRVVQTANEGARTYPFNSGVTVQIGAYAAADANAWYQCYYKDGSGSQDFGGSGAVTVHDASGNPVKGAVSGATTINFTYAYDTNTEAGLSAGTDKEVIFLCEGNGAATQALADFTITRSAAVAASCVPGSENNI
jgi:hypothetical protein